MRSEFKREIVRALSSLFDKNAAPQYAEAALFQELRSALDLAYGQPLNLSEFRLVFQLKLKSAGRSQRAYFWLPFLLLPSRRDQEFDPVCGSSCLSPLATLQERITEV